MITQENAKEKEINNTKILTGVATYKPLKVQYIVLFCFILAFLVLMVCSANSFLYKFNDWVDLNWYITMGRGVAAGKVPYKDMFEQKGPLLYFVFALFSYFPSPYIATWIFEVICFALFLFLCFKISKLYLNDLFSIIAVILIAAIVPTSQAFVNGGGAVEEYILPILAYFVLTFLEYYENKKQISSGRAIVLGILLAAAFWMKFTTIFVPALMLLFWFVKSLIAKQYKQTFKITLFVILGFAIISLPILFYFIVNHAFNDLLHVYFYLNLFTYAGKFNFKEKLLNLIYQSAVAVILFIFGIVYLTIKKKYTLTAFFSICLVYHFYLAGRVYYSLPLQFFAFFGIVMLLKLFEKFNLSKILKIVVSVCVCVASLVTVWFCNNNIKQINRPREEYAQYQVANKIKSYGIENVSLFCYKMYDYGFYNALEVVPEEKYFAQNNFSRETLPEMFEAQDKAVRECHADFVVLNVVDYDEDNSIFSGYENVGEFSYYLCEGRDGYNISFVLLKKI